MKKILLGVLLLTQFSFYSNSQCTETSENRILLVGDSWAFFMNVDQTISKVMKDWGHSNYTYYTDLVLSENGAETDDFLLPAKQQQIQDKLLEFPSINIVHLSIGGNDVLGGWNVNFTPQQTDSIQDAVLGRLDSLVTFIKSVRPGIQILWSGYTYTNFGEVIGTLPTLVQANHPFYSTWQGMGFPTFTQLNAVQNLFTDRIFNQYSADPQVTVIPATGLMQYAFGQTVPLGVAPGGTYPAFTVPMPYGNPAYPSPKTTMRDYGLFRDCFHLSAAGYYEMVSNHSRKFYHKLLMDDVYATATFNESGTVTSLNNILADQYVGQENGESMSSIFSFDVQMANEAIEKASVFLRIDEITGTNFLTSGLEVKLKHGFFGAQSTLEASDFSASGDATAVPCVFGTDAVGKWVRLDLPANLLPFIQNGKIQIALSAPGVSASKVKFTDASDPELAPVLNLKFSGFVSAADLAKSEALIYPNPTTGNVTIQVDNGANLILSDLFVTDVTGRKVDFKIVDSSSIDISGLPEGMYILNFANKNERHSKKILKVN
ncbi:MAG: T9SS type A sorting domain-containing protein [Crocinitomicaceae bacterium]|nr:T9SS type A sorting domain-containing protein [Crocinitomicaceae bacterium]